MNKPAPARRDPICTTATALLVVDMQEDRVAAGAPLLDAGALASLDPIRRLLELARATDIRVVFVAHAHRQDGSDMGQFAQLYPAIREGRALIEGSAGARICEQLQPMPHEIVITKRRHSAFHGTDLEIVLSSLSIDTIAAVGPALSHSLLSTMSDAVARDYRTIFVGGPAEAPGAVGAEALSVDEFANLVMSARI